MQRRSLFAGARALAIGAGAGALGMTVGGATKAGASGRIPNVEVIAHDGSRYRFYDDLIRGRIVTLNFMFTGCGDTCPLVTQNLRQLQDHLGDRVGRDVWMLSLTLQPEFDTAEVLGAYAGSYDIRPGWLFLTGAPRDLDRLRRSLGFASVDPELDVIADEHTGLLRYGNDSLQRWSACPAMSRPEFLAKAITTQMIPGGDRRVEDRVGA